MEQVFISGYDNRLDTDDTEYNLVAGGDPWDPDLPETYGVISTSGKLKNLRVKLDVAPGIGKSYTISLYINTGAGWGNSALTCTVADAATGASDTEHEVSVSAGDLVCMLCVPSGSPSYLHTALWSLVFEGDTDNESLLLSHCRANTTAIYYATPMGIGTNIDELGVRRTCPANGIIKNLYVDLANDPGVAPEAYRFTLRVNGVDSTLQCTITADDTAGNDTAHEVEVSAGDILTVSVEPLNSPTVSLIQTGFGMTFVADIDMESLILGGSLADKYSYGTIEYNSILPPTSLAWNPDATNRRQLGQSCTLKRLYVLLSTAPGVDTSWTLTLCKNGVVTGLTVTISDSATSGNDTVNEVEVSDDDDLSIQIYDTGSPAWTEVFWSMVIYRAPLAPPGLENKSANMAAKMVAAGVL